MFLVEGARIWVAITQRFQITPNEYRSFGILAEEQIIHMPFIDSLVKWRT